MLLWSTCSSASIEYAHPSASSSESTDWASIYASETGTLGNWIVGKSCGHRWTHHRPAVSVDWWLTSESLTFLIWAGTMYDTNLIRILDVKGSLLTTPSKTTMASEKRPASVLSSVPQTSWFWVTEPAGDLAGHHEVLLWTSAKGFFIFQHYHESLFLLLF